MPNAQRPTPNAERRKKEMELEEAGPVSKYGGSQN